MPKNKLESSSASDSDSGPEDRTPVTKKAKTEDTAGSSSSSGKKNSSGETYWDLDKHKRVTVRTFKGKTYVDIREFYDAGGELKPGKKGISLTADLWRKVQDLIPAVNEAVSKN